MLPIRGHEIDSKLACNSNVPPLPRILPRQLNSEPINFQTSHRYREPTHPRVRRTSLTPERHIVRPGPAGYSPCTLVARVFRVQVLAGPESPDPRLSLSACWTAPYGPASLRLKPSRLLRRSLMGQSACAGTGPIAFPINRPFP
jgi:hypothetical protein